MSERKRADTMNENFYYACIYDILQDPIQHREKTAILNHMIAKIVELNSKQLQSITVDTHKPTIFREECPPLFHLLQMRKRRETRMNTNA